jgi:hypothetical protein
MRAHWIIGGTLAAFAAVSPAFAATDDPLDALKDADCKDRTTVDNQALVDAMVVKAGIRPTAYDKATEKIAIVDGKPILEKQPLGPAVQARIGDEAFRTLWFNAVGLTGGGYKSAHGYVVQIDRAAPESNDTRAQLFLSGQAPWLTVSCPQANHKPWLSRTIDSLSENLIVAETMEEAAKDGDRKPATLAWTRDRDGNSDSADVDIFIGFPAWDVGALEQGIRPFVAMQKDTSKAEEVNDLTAGIMTMWNASWPLSPTFTAALSAESDDEFDAEVWRGDLFAHLDVDCGFLGRGNWGVMCYPRLVADHANINDPGEKEKLAKLSSYTRLGAGLDIAWWYHLSEDLRLNLDAGYTFRNDVDGSDADAERTTFGISFSPRGADWFSFGAEWAQGEDLTSLESVDEIAVKIGFKH